MANIIQHKRSSTSGVAPVASGLSQGELAINIADGKLYTKNSSNTVINLGVTSISGTYITPSSGNFFNYLAVNGVPVSVSGHSHLSVPQAQSLVTAVFNKTASTIPKFSAVYINGGQGDQPTIQLAIAAGEGGSSRTYGITAEAITSMGSGTVIVAGALSGVNTDQFNPTAPTGDVNGTSLYLSPTVSGGLTRTKPYAPNHLVYMATIVRTHQNEGVVEVRVQNGYELEELHNVAISGVTDGQFLYYNGPSGLWQANNNIYSNGNNIGIGTSSPSTKLDINGELRTSGFRSYTDSISWFGQLDGSIGIAANVNPSGTWSSSTAFACFQGFNDAVTSYNPICLTVQNGPQLYLNTDGNVGVGITSPTTKLDVNGSIRSHNGSSDLVLGYNATYDQYGLHNFSSNPLYMTSDNNLIYCSSPLGITIDGDANNTILQPNTGGVTIGSTNSPNYTLDVNGTVGVSTSLMINSATASTIASFNSSKELTSLSTVTYPSLTELSYVKGATSSIQNQLNAKQATLTNPVTGTGIVNHVAYWNNASGILADSGQLVWDSTNNRLGISTNTPLTNFHIFGSTSTDYGLILVSGASTTTHIGLGISDTVPFLANISPGTLSSSVYGWGMFYRLSDGDFAISRKGGSTSWIRCLNIQRSNGYVGIGSSGAQAIAPPEMFTVDGHIRLADKASVGNKLQFYRGGGTANDYTIGTQGNHLAISTAPDSTTQRYTEFGYHSAGTWTPKTRLNNYTGALGVNLTTTPSGSLDVGGDIYVRGAGTTGVMYFKSGTLADTTCKVRTDTVGNLYLDAGAYVRCGNQDGRVDMYASSQWITIGNTYDAGTANQYVRFVPANTEMMRVTKTGVGFGGVTSPLDRIHVSGTQTTIRLNNGLSYDTQLRMIDTASDWSVGINQGNSIGSGVFSIRSNTASSHRLVIDPSGNVGIGTNTPSTRLQVNGFISQSANHITVGLTSDQTIPTGVDTVVQMTDKDDPNNWWNGTTYRFLPTVSGYYYISAQVNWKSDEGTGQINSQLRRNGTTFCLTMTPQINSTGNTITHSLNGIVNMNGSTDYVDLTAYTSASDGSQLISGTADQAWTKLEAFKIS